MPDTTYTRPKTKKKGLSREAIHAYQFILENKEQYESMFNKIKDAVVILHEELGITQEMFSREIEKFEEKHDRRWTEIDTMDYYLKIASSRV